MVSDATIAVGDVIKIHNWHGVVLEIHCDEEGKLSLLRVQTARNIFRGYGPEYIDVRLAPEAIEQASPSALQQEIETHQRLLEGAVDRLLTAVRDKSLSAVTTD
jgi:hypothetical protein